MTRANVATPCFVLLAMLSGCGDVASSQKQDVAELRRLPNNFAIDVNEAGEVIKVSITQKTGVRYIGGSPPITDEALLRISAIPTIRELHIPSGLNIHDAGFSHLRKLKQLEILTIVRCPHITDAGLRHLSELATLKELQLEDFEKITDVGIQHLSRLSKLEKLDLTSTTVSTGGLDHLQRLTSLTELNLFLSCRQKYEVTWRKHLSQLQRALPACTIQGLIELDVPPTAASIFNFHSTDDLSIPAVNLELGRLTTVELHLLGEFQDDDLVDTKLVNAVQNVESLRLSFSQNQRITDAALLHLEPVKNLEVLDLYKTNITDAGLAHLQNHTSLQRIQLWGTQVSDAGLPHLYGLSELDVVELTDTAVTETGMKELRRALPNCHVFGWKRPSD